MSGCENQEPLSPEPTAIEPLPSLGKANVTNVQGNAWISERLGSGEIFITPGGTVHMRYDSLKMTVIGDVEGVGIFVQHYDFDLEYQSGHVSGPFTLQATWQGRSGIFSGQVSGNVDDGLFKANFSLQGSDGLKGLKFQATIEGILSGMFSYSGRILDTKGG